MISIIIPTLNEAKDIEKTFQSLRELNICDYEIIVSDGRSTDNTIELANKYGAKVVVYSGTKRQTISNARNLGASIAIGDVFVFLDADVTIPDINGFFKKTLDLFQKEVSLVALTVRLKILPELETFADKFFLTFFAYINFLGNNVFGIGAGSGEFQMIRAATFKKIKGYNENIAVAEDVDIFQRLAKQGKTRIEMSLCIMQTGRRVHKVGWPKLLWQWSINGFSVMFLKRSYNSVWEEIR